MNGQRAQLVKYKISPVHVVVIVLMLLGIWHVTSSVYIYAKAVLAQTLLQTAWEESLETGENIKPWSWADTWPIARLEIPQHDVDMIVLAGDSGRTLAFGPGHRFGTAAPGEHGNSVISGHRDTHFSFLKELTSGDMLRVQARDGQYNFFTVTGSLVIDQDDAMFSVPEQGAALTLVTCYPFDEVEPGGTLRYVVFAEETHSKILL